MNRTEIRQWLLGEGITQAEIARSLGVSKSLVTKVLNGQRRNNRIVGALKKMGCPEELLLPDEERAA